MRQQKLFEQFPDPNIPDPVDRQLPAEQRSTIVKLLAELMGRIVDPNQETPPGHGTSPEGPNDE